MEGIFSWVQTLTPQARFLFLGIIDFLLYQPVAAVPPLILTDRNVDQDAALSVLREGAWFKTALDVRALVFIEVLFHSDWTLLQDRYSHRRLSIFCFIYSSVICYSHIRLLKPVLKVLHLLIDKYHY